MAAPANRTNVAPRERQAIEGIAKAEGRLERLEYRSETGHVTTEFVGDIGVFLGQFRPPVSQRIRGWAKKEKR